MRVVLKPGRHGASRGPQAAWWIAALLVAAGTILVAAWLGPSRIASEVLYVKRLVADRVDCPAQTPRTMVAFVFGQSNAANSGAYRHRAGNSVVNFAHGRCFRAQDPLIGAGGIHGSVWGIFADMVASRHDHVLLVPAGVGATAIAQWNSELAPMLVERKRELRMAGYSVTHYLWHHGESDAAAATPSREYERELRALIARVRADERNVPFWVATASVCQNAGNASIAAAQRAVVQPAEGVFAGPDTDALEPADRHDGCHFSRQGQEKVAAMWAAAVGRDGAKGSQ